MTENKIINNVHADTTRKIYLKDVIYWILILLIFIAGLIIYIINDESNLVNLISLIASGISISLAFIAIIYAFYQTWVNQKESKILSENIAKLSEETENISQINSFLEEMKDLIDSGNESTNEMKIIVGSVNEKVIDLLSKNNEEALQIPYEAMHEKFPNISGKELTEIIGFVNNYQNDLVNSYETSSNGYQRIKDFISSFQAGDTFTTSSINENFKGSDKLTTGQIAGALYRLKNDQVISTVERGKYKKN